MIPLTGKSERGIALFIQSIFDELDRSLIFTAKISGSMHTGTIGAATEHCEFSGRAVRRWYFCAAMMIGSERTGTVRIKPKQCEDSATCSLVHCPRFEA